MLSRKLQLVTGAEALAFMLKQAGVKHVFAYPGTSELALCDAILRISGIELINGRGDKESAFMAAGGSLFSPLHSAALLHGARGVTNAAGAVADARRNEIGTVFIVGLPSTSSQKYLPPHGEEKLIDLIGGFSKSAWEIINVSQLSDNATLRYKKAAEFVKVARDALQHAVALPRGPTVLGVPQDALEKRWIPISLLKTMSLSLPLPTIDTKKIEKAIRLIKSKQKPLILVDDFLYKDPDAKALLLRFAEHVGAPVFQVWYRRGPMLFESTRFFDNPYFVGYYDLKNAKHEQLMRETDLLITLEDRNMYERVIGAIPSCEKIAITSHRDMTKKNGYLKHNDILIDGRVSEAMEMISNSLPPNLNRQDVQRVCLNIGKKGIDESVSRKYAKMRLTIAEELASVFTHVGKPVLVDDSQMFGGLLAQHYNLFPKKLRVFGDHGGFIGGGMALATGLARCDSAITVFCTIGDQSFTNAIQALASMVQELAPAIYIICNNGRSVSLAKQMLSQDSSAFDHGRHPFLQNIENFSYLKLVESFGIPTAQINCNPGVVSNVKLRKQLREEFNRALCKQSPVFIELLLPSDQKAWNGIWSVSGNEVKMTPKSA